MLSRSPTERYDPRKFSRYAQDLSRAILSMRRLTEPAIVDGIMRPAGFEFEDTSAGPHRRTSESGFAYHPQFVDLTVTPLPPLAPMTEPKKMTPPGSFAAGLKAMMDEARAGVEKARTDGHAKVKEAVGKLAEAKVATVTVSANIAKTIEDEAASVMSELGQISNDLGSAA